MCFGLLFLCLLVCCLCAVDLNLCLPVRFCMFWCVGSVIVGLMVVFVFCVLVLYLLLFKRVRASCQWLLGRCLYTFSCLVVRVLALSLRVLVCCFRAC